MVNDRYMVVICSKKEEQKLKTITQVHLLARWLVLESLEVLDNSIRLVFGKLFL